MVFPRKVNFEKYQQWTKKHKKFCVQRVKTKLRTLVKSVYQNIFFFFYFSTKTYVVGIQKNRLNETVLNETVLLSIQNICLN